MGIAIGKDYTSFFINMNARFTIKDLTKNAFHAIPAAGFQ
jgi:hypothetical protein